MVRFWTKRWRIWRIKYMAHKFEITSAFKGYHAREDITNLPPGYLVKGSKDVLSNSANRIGVRKGYTLDGQANSALFPIRSAYDWNTHLGTERNLRCHSGDIEYRYVDSLGVVTWRTLASLGLNYNFTQFWNDQEDIDVLLFCCELPFVAEWSGGITTFASAAATTITKEGTTTWAEEGFYFQGNQTASTIAFVNNPGTQNDTITDSASGFLSAGFYGGQIITITGSASNDGTYQIANVVAGTITLSSSDNLVNEAAGAAVTIIAERQVEIGGITYTYTGGENTTTLTGVTPDPTVGGHVVGDVIHQRIRIVPNSSMLGIPLSFNWCLISTLYNQVYGADTASHSVYVSQIESKAPAFLGNSFTNFLYSTPRAVGEGALITLDSVPTGIIPQEDQMYMSAGRDQWYRTQFELSSDLSSESLTIQRLKTNSNTAARYQSYISKDDNKIVYVNFTPEVDVLGRVDNIFALPDIQNLSDSIRDDMNTYDFSSTFGDIAFFKNFIYISIPASGVVLVYNIVKQWWEAPLALPVGRFSIIGGELYGHSAAVPETYKLFDGFNDNGHPILANAVFSYENFGLRANLKSFDEFYTEGYISSNTNLTIGIRYEIDGCGTETFQNLSGADSQVVCIGGDDNSLGKQSLGKYPLGTLLFGPNDLTLPPKFRVIKTFPKYDFYEVQYSFSSYGEDQRWELLAFGPNALESKNDNIHIKE